LHFYEINSHTSHGKQNFAYSFNKLSSDFQNSYNKLSSFQNIHPSKKVFAIIALSDVICNQAQSFYIYGDKTFALKLITVWGSSA